MRGYAVVGGPKTPAPSNGWIAYLPAEYQIVFGVIAIITIGFFIYWLLRWAK